MDPVAHTLVGATLAESGLRRATPLATATVILGANAPDIDIVSGLVGGSDAALYWRRGLTHGVLGVVVLPLVLTGLMLAWDRFVRRRRDPDAEPARAGPLLVLSVISILTHPALDWLNTYGVRLLMPFDGTWFYGDSVFIVDPWLWLLMAAPVILARTDGKLSAAAWIVLGAGATALVGLVGMVPLASKIAWLVGVAAIVVVRLTGAARERVTRVAVVCLSLLLAYVGAMIIGSRVARRQADAWLTEQGIAQSRLVARPAPADPFAHEVIAATADGYRFVRIDWLEDPVLRFGHPFVPRGERDAVVEAALRAPQVRGMTDWMRLPAFAEERTDDGWVVTIRDVRYSRPGMDGFGTAVVHLDESLEPR